MNEIIDQITTLLEKKKPVVVAVSGFGGSGKTTLTDHLRDAFGIKDAQVIRIDHLYGPNLDGPDIFDQSDWPLIIDILENAQAGKPLQYTGKGYRGEAIEVDEDLPPVLLIEGVRLIQKRLLPLFDISIWLDCPQEIALQRAKARDRLQGEDEATVSLWDTDWGPKDKTYFETCRPDLLSDYVVPTSKPTLID